jgi:hypothetical protein
VTLLEALCAVSLVAWGEGRAVQSPVSHNQVVKHTRTHTSVQGTYSNAPMTATMSPRWTTPVHCFTAARSPALSPSFPPFVL